VFDDVTLPKVLRGRTLGSAHSWKGREESRNLGHYRKKGAREQAVRTDPHWAQWESPRLWVAQENEAGGKKAKWDTTDHFGEELKRAKKCLKTLI